MQAGTAMAKGIQALAMIAIVFSALASRARPAVAGPAKQRPAQDASDEDDPPLTSLEARFGYGLAFGGGAGGSVQRVSPLTVTMLVDQAVVVDPWTSMFAGVIAEGKSHGAAGVVVGARVRPERGRLRIAGGAEALLFPFTLIGPLASVGTCLPFGDIWSLCVDGEATLFVLGSDLPDQRIAGQAQLVVGIAFDAW